jgi:ABC-2 type transport system ATP-binding protein
MTNAEATVKDGAAIVISDLVKRYGDTLAVDDLSLSIREGEIFGILGPNGAGKTTTVECVEGLRRGDSGTVEVFGLDPAHNAHQLHQLMGVQLQDSALQEKLRVAEILDLYQSFYEHPMAVDDLVDSLDLRSKMGDYYRSLSGGQKQRLSIALALIGRPRVAILDEMTSGLDPQARRDIWSLIEKMRDDGVTILLVTHYMDEAERLCDRLALIDRGKIVKLGTPHEVATSSGVESRVVFTPSAPFDESLLTSQPGVSHVSRRGNRVVVDGKQDLVNCVILTLAAHGVTAHGVTLETPTLEDAFLRLTGRRLHEVAT